MAAVTDRLPGEEGAVVLCSSWLVDDLGHASQASDHHGVVSSGVDPTHGASAPPSPLGGPAVREPAGDGAAGSASLW